jgi:hypothetical protein
MAAKEEFYYELEYAQPRWDATSDTWMRDKIDVLPLYGVHFNSYLVTRGNSTRYGDCTATVRSDKRTDLDDLLLATEPGMVNLWVWQGNQPVWGGIVWSRTYSSQGGGTYQLYAQTFDSYGDNYVFTTNRTWVDDAQNIIKIVWDEVQLQPPGVNEPTPWNIAFEVHQPPKPIVSSITKNVVGNEHVVASDIIAQMIELGAEYRINYFKDIYGRPRARFDVGRWDGLAPKVGIPAGPASPDLTYPGDISNFWYSESGSKGGTHFYAIGKGTGGTTPIGSHIDDQWEMNPRRPAVSKKLNLREADTQAILDDQLYHTSLNYRLPMVTPTFKLQDASRQGDGLQFKTTNRKLFDSLAIGDHVYVVLDDAGRFKTPYKAYYRCISKSLSPGTGEFEIGIDQYAG